ncbi:MAG: HIT domain-containing protein [Dokdonella sp.]
METEFNLDPRLANDCHLVGDLDLCRVLLMDDSRFPWLILVPRCHGLRELADLDRRQQHRLLEEIDCARLALRVFGEFDKLNVAALGNVVAQLHVHVIARRIGDAAWPAPVWNHGNSIPYSDRDDVLEGLRYALQIG